MKLKERSESRELLVLRSLNARMQLSKDDLNRFDYLEKGFAGERLFDEKCEILNEERYLIEDLQLEVNRASFQIDTVIISQSVIHFLDVKNLSGACYFEGDKLFSVKTNREYKNPLVQLKRASTLFRQLLQNLKFSFLVDPRVIFIDSDFTLYQAPIDKTLVLPTQVNSLLSEINNTPSKLNDTHRKLAQELLSLHQVENSFTKLPEYKYEDLRRGVCCEGCGGFEVRREANHFVCNMCGVEESIESIVIRHAREYQLLFPEQKVTTASIYDWLNVSITRKTIFRILKKNLKIFGTNNKTYFL